ncbi:MAG TPA: DUF4340 domain-containing protein [Spirochaetes bacterium]|nr:DUF4340 domain-containing protein [Spirochaetota bacterium]
MKFFRKAVILGAVLVIAGGAYWFFEIKKKKEKAEVEKKEAMLVEQSDIPIVKLSLAPKGGEPIILERIEKEVDDLEETGGGEEIEEPHEWNILSPVETGGDKYSIGSVIRSIKDSRREDVIYENLDKMEEYGLGDPGFLITFFYEGDETEHGIAFGVKSLDGKKIFARVLGKDKIFSIPVDLLGTLNRSLFDMRDKRIAGFDPADVVSVSLVSMIEAFMLEKENDEWYFQPEGIKASKARVEMYAGSLSWGSFVSVEEEKGEDFIRYGLNAPRVMVNFKLEDDSNFMFVVGDMIEEGEARFFYATRTSDDMIFQVQADLVSRLLKTKFELKDRRIFDFTADEVTEITLEKEDKSFHLVREGKSWKFEGMEEKLERDYRIDNIVRGIAEAEYEQVDPVKRGSSEYDETGIENIFYTAILFFDDEKSPVTVTMTERDEETNKIWLTPDNGETAYFTSGYFVSNFPETKEDYLE